METAEKITVTLPETSRHSLQPVSLKYERQIDGEIVLSYINNGGQLINLPIEKYVEGVSSGKSMKYLGVKNVKFTSKIANLTDGMDERDIRTSNIGLTYPNTLANKGVIEFWKNHPQCEVDGVFTGNGKILFIVTTSSKIKNKRVTDRKVRMEISLFVDSMNESTLRDVLVYFGKQKGDRNKDEMVNALIEGETVISISGEKSESPAILFEGNNLAEFRKTFMDKNNPNLRLLLNINKAKLYKLINISGEGASQGWYLNGSFLAPANDDTTLQTYFTANKPIFDSLIAKIERIEEGEHVTPKESMIPEPAKTDTINRKNKLVSELNTLVTSGKVILPEDSFVPDMEMEELEEYIASANKTEEVKSENKSVSHIVEPRKEGESVVQYKGRLSKKVGELVGQGNIELPEGTKRTSLTVSDLESYLSDYEKKLNSPA